MNQCIELNLIFKDEMSLKRFQDFFIVLNSKGLHTRPSTELAKRASAFKSRVTLRLLENRANAKSLMAILMLTASRGSKVLIEAVGEDAEEAVKSIIELAQNKFHIKY